MMPGGIRLPLFFLFLLAFSAEVRVWAVEPEDSITYSYDLEDLEVTGTSLRPLRQGGSMEISRERLMTGMRVFGEADALKLIGRQAGVSTAGDYGSGLFIDGLLPSHSLYRIDGVPVFFPYRFGGIFSTFNSGHFSNVDFERGIHKSSMPTRLGAKLDFSTPRDVPSTFSGTANVGMMASSLSVRMPAGNKVAVSFSGRISYVNQLYGWMLIKENSGIKYDFGDLNLTLLYTPDEDNRLRLNLFGNSDFLSYADDNYAMDLHMNWRNGLASLEWTHFGAITTSHRIFVTYFGNVLRMEMPQLSLSAPSSIAAMGVAGEAGKWGLSPSFSMEGGYEINYYNERIQYLNLSGISQKEGTPALSHPFETRVYADGEWRFGHDLRLDVGLSLALYHNSGGFTRLAPDPRISLYVPVSYGNLGFHIGKYSQFLHQVGFSQIGMASDFWIGSGIGLEPESAVTLEADYTGGIPHIGLTYSANIYARRVFHQAELMGELLSILDSDYGPEDYIRTANGYAAGANASLRIDHGALGASLSVGYGLTRMRYPETGRYTRGRSEPGFSFGTELEYRFNTHWTIGGAFRFATGRPYTPVTSLYLVAGNVIKNYGAPNSALLPSWHRLDLNANWSVFSGPVSHPLRHIVSVSLINAYGRRNPEFITYVIDIDKGVVKIKTVASLYRFFPSLSYSLIF